MNSLREWISSQSWTPSLRPPGSGRTRRWRCPEPSHPDEHPSVTVSRDQRGVDRWRCWSGGHGGTAIDAVVAARHLSVGESIRWLNEHYAHPEPLPQRPHREVHPRSDGRPSPEVIQHVERCEKQLWTWSGREIRSWLNARGLTDDVLVGNRSEPAPAWSSGAESAFLTAPPQLSSPPSTLQATSPTFSRDSSTRPQDHRSTPTPHDTSRRTRDLPGHKQRLRFGRTHRS